MRTFAEFHDSRVRSIVKDGNEIIVEFPHVYLHVFEGEPFKSPGNGCGQAGRLIFSGVQSCSIPELPTEDDDDSFDVWKGSIWADDNHLNNVFEIPLRIADSEIRAEILFNLGMEFKVSCTAVSYTALNDPRFIEHLRA